MIKKIKRAISLIIVGCCIFSGFACKNNKSEDVSVCEHSYTNKITQPPTCGVNGVKTFTCVLCGDIYMEDIPQTGNHTFTNEITKEPSCAETGVETYTCLVCGNVYNKDIEKTDNHTYTSLVIKEATADANGERHFFCNICDDSYIESFKLARVQRAYPDTYRIKLDDGGSVRCSIESFTLTGANKITGVRVKYQWYTSYLGVLSGFALALENDSGTDFRVALYPVFSRKSSDVDESYEDIKLSKPIQLEDGETYKIYLTKR